MRLCINSENSETLKQAREYLNGFRDKIKILKEEAISFECSADLPEDACSALLNYLLNSYEDLDITAVIISDVPGRDRSFWNTERYKSMKDENGERYFEIDRSTGWA